MKYKLAGMSINARCAACCNTEQARREHVFFSVYAADKILSVSDECVQIEDCASLVFNSQ